MYDYHARAYDPALGRFLSADTLVPSPQNPQSLNRYAYTLNNSLKYIDPTGHFTDDALKTYLQKLYGDAWQSHWDSWQTDSNWMKLVRVAQAGDILTWVTANAQGQAFLQTFQFQGQGQEVLSMLSQIQDIGANPEQTGHSANLDWFFSHRGKGIGVVRFDASGDVSVVGKIGEIALTTHKVTRSELRYSDIICQWGIPTVVGLANPWLGAIVGFGEAALNREISEIPGNVEGDNELTVTTFSPSGPPDSYYGTPIIPGNGSGYKYIFRGGRVILRSGVNWSVYVPHRPY